MALPLVRVKPTAIIPAINWQSGWLNDVAFICFCNERNGNGGILELVSGKTLAGGSTSAKANSIYGNTALFDGTNNSSYTNAQVSPFHGTTGGAQTGEITMLALASIASSASAISQPFGQSTASNNDGFSFYANSTLGFLVSAGTGAFICRHNGFNEGLLVAGIVDGSYHVYCGRRQQGTLRIFLDGFRVGSSVASTFDVLGASPHAKLEIGGTTTNGTMTGNIAFVVGWNRGLSDLEIQQFSSYLWDAFLLDDLDGLHASIVAATASMYVTEFGFS